jgi:hypothetical protein
MKAEELSNNELKNLIAANAKSIETLVIKVDQVCEKVDQTMDGVRDLINVVSQLHIRVGEVEKSSPGRTSERTAETKTFAQAAKAH